MILESSLGDLPVTRVAWEYMLEWMRIELVDYRFGRKLNQPTDRTCHRTSRRRSVQKAKDTAEQ